MPKGSFSAWLEGTCERLLVGILGKAVDVACVVSVVLLQIILTTGFAQA